MSKSEGFFCISPAHIETLSTEDVRTFVAYLVMSCGTGGDNTTTKWSVQSVEKYGHMRTEKAREAVERLKELGIVVQDMESSRPRHPVHKIQGHGTRLEGQVWLPRTLVEGADQKEKDYPLRRIRESGDPLLLRLLLDLYAHHDLPEWGGVNPKAICKRQEVAAKIDAAGGAMNVWGFDTKPDAVWPVLSTIHKNLGEIEDFWKRLSLLKSFGHLEEVITLLDSPDGDPIFSCEDDAPILGKLKDCCEELLFDKNWAYAYMYVLPIPAHIQEPHLISLYRLKYRPHTKRTAAWFAKMNQANDIYLKQVKLPEVEKLTPAPTPQPAEPARRGFWASPDRPGFDPAVGF